MPEATQPKRPAPVPGDAEAPARSETDRTAKDAVRHSDPTEPTPTPQQQHKTSSQA